MGKSKICNKLINNEERQRSSNINIRKPKQGNRMPKAMFLFKSSKNLVSHKNEQQKGIII